MLKCSAKMYRVHKFRHNDRLYIADLDRFRLVEVNEIAWNAMAFTSTLDTDGIVEQLSQTYPRELVLETLKSLEDFQNNDVIFSASWTLPFETNGDRLKIYVPQSRNEWFLDPETISGGTNVALYHTTRSLSQFSDIYLSSAILV